MSEQNDYAEELNPTKTGLVVIERGDWPEKELDIFKSILINFDFQNEKTEYGKLSLIFRIVGDRPGLQTPNYERMWPVVTWLLDQQEQTARPYGKIFAIRAASGWLVELWHDGASKDPSATKDYMGRLFQVLVEHGLQPTEWQKGQDTAVGEKVIYTPQIAEEITGRFSFDFLDAAVRKTITNFPYPWECPSRIEGKSAVYMLQDNNGKMFMAITVEPHVSNGTFMVSIGRGTQNELMDDTKLASVHNQLYQSLVDAMHAQAFAITPAASKQDKLVEGYDNTAVSQTVTNNIYNVGNISNSTGIAIGTGASANIGNALKGNYGDTAVPTPNDSALTAKEREYRSELLKILRQYFNENDLKTLYFELGWEYGLFESGGKDAQARALVEKCFREARQNELVDLIAQYRPNITLPKSLE